MNDVLPRNELHECIDVKSEEEEEEEEFDG